MSQLPTDERSVPISVMRPSTTQVVAFSGTAASTSTPFTSNVVRVVTDRNCHVSITGTATTSDMYLPAGVVEYLHVPVGGALSFVDSGNGNAYVTEMV